MASTLELDCFAHALERATQQAALTELARESSVRSQQALRWALRFSRCAIYPVTWTSPDARFIYVNDATCAHLGYSRRELLSMSVPDIAQGLTLEVWQDYWQGLKQQGCLTVGALHRCKDGSLVSVENSVCYLEFRGREYTVACSRELSQQRRGLL
ncbi:PAS domain S-box protein [Leptolyngbya sp. FACHB-261]|uniref:PAS domain S-box protein n=1 Tax=Leptolyngbya sp. FACHB-261 TaxID=2692806 RepID=UPI001682CFDB|nr:PAS domain S-box protein [Leptolyngbya sp. FACHB-261]MBD2100667.1 PAS domain S-box protein [Leptolyngbya sp. FACHB-261]